MDSDHQALGVGVVTQDIKQKTMMLQEKSGSDSCWF